MKKELKADALLFPAPTLVVGTYNEEKEPDVMTVAWAGLCSSVPPCIMIAIRKERLTYENIKKTQAFTVNIPDKAHIKEADYFGLVSGKKEKKVEKSGLTAVSAAKVDAPIIKEFPFALECKFVKELEMGSHMMVIGEIVSIQAEESCLNEKGIPDIKKLDPLHYDAAQNQYYMLDGTVEKAFHVGVPILTGKDI